MLPTSEGVLSFHSFCLIHFYCILRRREAEEITENFPFDRREKKFVNFLLHMIYFHHIDIIFLPEAIFHFICFRKKNQFIYLREILNKNKNLFSYKSFLTLNEERSKVRKKLFETNNSQALYLTQKVRCIFQLKHFD